MDLTVLPVVHVSRRHVVQRLEHMLVSVIFDHRFRPLRWYTPSAGSQDQKCPSVYTLNGVTSTGRKHTLDKYIPFFLIPFVGWGMRRYLVTRDDFTPLKKITLAIGVSAYFVTEIARSFYRPYIYANEVNDWVIADTIGNSLGTVTAIFVILTMAGRGTNWDWRLVGTLILGLLAYESINLMSDHPFDFNDALATIIFGGISVLIYATILRRYADSGPAVRLRDSTLLHNDDSEADSS